MKQFRRDDFLSHHQPTVRLSCSIYCHFLLFFHTSESRSTQKEQNKFDDKLNIKDAWWTRTMFVTLPVVKKSLITQNAKKNQLGPDPKLRSTLWFNYFKTNLLYRSISGIQTFLGWMTTLSTPPYSDSFQLSW